MGSSGSKTITSRLIATASAVLSWFVLVSGAYPQSSGRPAVALLPFANYTEVRQAPEIIMPLVVESLRARGFEVVTGPPVEDVLYRHRVRQTTMLGEKTARALAKDLEVGGGIVGMISLAQEKKIPQVGISARLLALPEGTVLWAHDVALSGEDFTGLLGLGTVRSIKTLSALAVDRLLDTLEPRLEPQFVPPPKAPGLLRGLARPEPPQIYRDPLADFYGVDSLGVLPFLNASGRPNAGDIVAALFVSALHNTRRFSVVEPGIVRDVSLRFRIGTVGAIDSRGLRMLNRHMRVHGYVLGTVYEYIEGGPRKKTTVPKVTISARMVRALDGQVVWSMEHRHKGDDFNLLLDFDRIYSIIPLVRLTVAEMVQTFTPPPE